MIASVFLSVFLSGATAGEVTWVEPVRDHARITAQFGESLDPLNAGKKRFHSGTDFAAPYGTSVLASAPGTVSYAQEAGGWGRKIVIDHGNGWQSSYSHLGSIETKLGDKVTAGEMIATIGVSGRSTGPHVHFEILQDGVPMDPSVMLKTH